MASALTDDKKSEDDSDHLNPDDMDNDSRCVTDVGHPRMVSRLRLKNEVEGVCKNCDARIQVNEVALTKHYAGHFSDETCQYCDSFVFSYYTIENPNKIEYWHACRSKPQKTPDDMNANVIGSEDQ